MIDQVMTGVLSIYFLAYFAGSLENEPFSYFLHGCVFLLIGLVYWILREAKSEKVD